MAENYTQRLMKTDHEKSRDAVLAERRRCAAIARGFSDAAVTSADWPNVKVDWATMVRLITIKIAEEIERAGTPPD